MTPEQFYAQYLPYAQSVSQRTGLDPRLVLAQSALETGYGKSAPGMNFFGIKSHGRKGGNTLSTQEFEGGRMVQQPASFRGYETPEQSFMDYADFITSNPRYKGVLAADGLEAQIGEMAKSGYATDPNYGSKLASIASRFDPNSPKVIAAETMSLLGKGPQTSTKGPQMMQEQKPQGLLGSLGIQKRDEAAGGETALPFYQRDTFKDTAAILAQGFGRMGIMGMEEIADDIAKQRTENKARNKTAEYLRKAGRGDLADMVDQGMIGGREAAGVLLQKPATGEVREIDGKLVRVMPDGSSQVVYQPTQQEGFLDKDQLSGLNSLRDDLRTELKPFEIVKSGYNNITTFYNNPSATSDYALAVAFAKILDPGSVAREGEVAAVQNAGARIPALGQALKNAVTGEGQLTQEVRQQIAELATKVYTERQGEAQKTIAGYGEIAKRAGLPADFLYSGSIPEAAAVVPAVVPGNAASQGVTQAMWDEASMEEKKAWLE